jgi:hypothetical protein
LRLILMLLCVPLDRLLLRPLLPLPLLPLLLGGPTRPAGQLRPVKDEPGRRGDVARDDLAPGSHHLQGAAAAGKGRSQSPSHVARSGAAAPAALVRPPGASH